MNKIAQWLSRELDDILDELSFYIVSDGSISGPEGLTGLRLIANCLFEQFAEDETPKHPSKSSTTEANSRLGEVKKKLTKLAKTTGAWFIVCFQLDGSDRWCMAWSDCLDADTARAEIEEYVGSSFSLEW